VSAAPAIAGRLTPEGSLPRIAGREDLPIVFTVVAVEIDRMLLFRDWLQVVEVMNPEATD
jgi:hypothetical protein